MASKPANAGLAAQHSFSRVEARAAEMAQRIEALAAEPDLSSDPHGRRRAQIAT